MATTTSPDSKKPDLKILMLHGFTQSGDTFHAKTRALEKYIRKLLPTYTLHFSYPSGPHHLNLAEMPYVDKANLPPRPEEADTWAWWRKDDDTQEYRGLDGGFARIAETLRTEGPFAGVIGFSQGAAAATMVASLLEPKRKEAFKKKEKEQGGIPYPASFDALEHPELQFCVAYSGFAAPQSMYEGFYNPRISTPTLHVLGSLDTLVGEERSRTLMERCDHARSLIHPGGHFVPSQRTYLDGVGTFIQDCLNGNGKKTNESDWEDDVGDMNVPF
ncbi:MAG: hypothetical protein M1834_003392 [Cirrosporium novae-zelandiae]|nr:MAG: hypothetical protein M1834_003392 [Cirrosporium novae-zelandiae]